MQLIQNGVKYGKRISEIKRTNNLIPVDKKTWKFLSNNNLNKPTKSPTQIQGMINLIKELKTLFRIAMRKLDNQGLRWTRSKELQTSY